MSLALVPDPLLSDLRRRSRPGRPVVAESPAERLRHIDVALEFLSPHLHRDGTFRRYPAKRVARAHEISRRTVHIWTAKALSYLGVYPEANCLAPFADPARN